MKKDEFEARVLDLWMTSVIPLTYTNVQYHTGVPARKARQWLDSMARDGTLDVESTDRGELAFEVPGTARPSHGPRTFAELEKLQGMRGGKAAGRRGKSGESNALTRLRDQYEAGTTALAVAQSARQELTHGRGAGQKSLLVSGALSLIFGPAGWLYAGSWREAIPAALIYLLAFSLVPTFLLLPILGVALPISGIVGLVYAWQHNRGGKRGALFSDDD